MLLLITSAAARFLEWAAEHSWDRWMGYIFVPLTLVSVSRSAAVLGSSNVSTPKTQELSVISPALKPAAPEDGRTPLNRYDAGAPSRACSQTHAPDFAASNCRFPGSVYRDRPARGFLF